MEVSAQFLSVVNCARTEQCICQLLHYSSLLDAVYLDELVADYRAGTPPVRYFNLTLPTKLCLQ